jgi:hypothetical protein
MLNIAEYVCLYILLIQAPTAMEKDEVTVRNARRELIRRFPPHFQLQIASDVQQGISLSRVSYLCIYIHILNIYYIFN